MKARYSEQYYKDNWNLFIKKVNSNDYMDLEQELKEDLSIFDKEIIDKIQPIYAKKIYDKAVNKLKEKMAIINEIESGKVSLGYTTKSQEVQEMHRIIQRFEFNCFQLKLFKDKYNLA